MEPLANQGGTCAPPSPFFDLRPPLDQLRLERAAKAGRDRMMGLGHPLPAEDEAVDIARAILTEYQIIRLADTIPPLSAPRGAIKFLTPGPYKPPTRADVWRAKVKRRRERIVAPFRRMAAARKRLSDARAVWHGTKDAYSDAEIEKLSEW